MKENEHSVGSDTVCVLEYLKRRPDDFISDAEISRQADSETGSKDAQNWSQPALFRLLALNKVETDGSGYYRLKTAKPGTENGSTKKFISPLMRMLLKPNCRKIDPTGYS
jgi:hypothetical protein